MRSGPVTAVAALSFAAPHLRQVSNLRQLMPATEQ